MPNAELSKEVNFLRYYYTSQEMNFEKDHCKDSVFVKYSQKMAALWVVPFGFQIW